MTVQTLRNLIYYPKGPAGIEADLATLATNPFYSNVVLGQFHFNEPAGAITWNETLITSVASSVWKAVDGLSHGTYPKKVSMQIGTAGNGTWNYIQNHMDDAATALVKIVTGGHPIIGIDLDPEPPGKVALETIYDFTLLLGSYKQKSPFYLSHVPVPWDGNYFPQLYGPDYWPSMFPFVDWITPQWYDSTGATLVSDYEQFVSAHSAPPPYGLPPGILVAGQQSTVTTLDALLSAIKSLKTKYGANWGGVGVWAYPLPTSPDWAQAIYKAMHTGEQISAAP